ncbi:protein FAM91A1 [Dermatophagoides pteronyssinus]|uniref:protein FAM91A1 n=1 Tax=Dermatophagoides pteronyssinus TaxID=6956 RepID=UPI003F6623F9
MDIEYYIVKNIAWNKLPAEVQSLIDNSDEYAKKIKEYSVVNQLKYKDNLIRQVEKNQRAYHEQLLRYSREHYMLFPYHLSEYIINGMRITPFQYYQAILIRMIEQEKNYDTLPNFTAADCFRLMGIGRNQYIDIINQYKSSKKFLGMIKKPIKELLPTKPVENLNIDFWWTIRPGYISEDDIKSMVTVEEKTVIDIIVNDLSKPFPAGNFPYEIILNLYIKGLIYFDIIIQDDDLIYIPPLEGFVMNRTTGDYFEKLLYKIFVSIDEKTTIFELSEVLKIDLNLVKNAISMYCRLGFAFKKNNDINVNNCHDSWLKHMTTLSSSSQNNNNRQTFNLKENFINSLKLTDEPPSSSLNVIVDPIESSNGCSKKQNSDNSSSELSPNSPIPSIGTPSPSLANDNSKRIGLLYDSTLAAFLMMGNLTPGLKSHAVTMFEVGKLSDESIENFVLELEKIEDYSTDDEGCEAERYFLHAILLCRTIQFLRHNFDLTKDFIINDNNDLLQHSTKGLGLDLIRCESLLNLDQDSCERLLMRNYELLISVAPLSNETQIFTSDLIPYFGASSLVNSIWFKLYLYSITGSGPISFLISKGVRLARLPDILYNYDCIMLTPWGRDSTVVSISNALIAINETTIFNPVLIQAYPQNHFKLTESELLHIPLPLLDDQSKDENLYLEFFLKHSAIKRMRQHINLNRICGYLTLINYHKPLCDIDQLNLNEWCIFDCHFGIPLFDRQLNKDVCNRIRSNRLFDKEKLKDLIESNKKLFHEIDVFIRKNITPLSSSSSSKINYDKHQQQYQVPLPPNCIMFDEDGNLDRLCLN